MAGPNPFYTLLDTNCLTGPNFNEWLRNLRIVLSSEKIDYVLDNPPLKEIQEDANEDEKKAFKKWRDDDNKARCYMLASMNNELQKQHLKIENAYEMLLQVQKTCVDLRIKRYNTSKELFRMRMSDDSSVHVHASKMVGYIEQLEKLGAYMSKELAVGLILQSLPDSFSEFITNFNMKKENCQLSELVSMLVNAEASITKTQDLVNMKKEDYKLSEVISMLASAEITIRKAQGLLLESSESSGVKAKIEAETIKEVQLNSVIGFEKAELKPEGGATKPELELEGSIEKTVLEEVNCNGECFQCGKEGHLKEDCRSSLVPIKTVSAEAAENPDEWQMWKKPVIGWIKLNTHARTKGFGGLFRDHEGQPLFGYVVKVSSDDIYSLQLHAIVRGLELAITNGIRYLWIESDYLSAVEAINKELPGRPPSVIYLNQILQGKELFEKFQISYSWRESNRAADHLSKMDRTRENLVIANDAVLRPLDFPDNLWTIIREDAEGRLYRRKKRSSTCKSPGV